MNARCKGWWTRNASVVSGISNIATALAAICVAITLVVSVSHLNLAREQFENTALSLRASTAFVISQEGREIAKLLRKDLKKNTRSPALGIWVQFFSGRMVSASHWSAR